MIGWLPLVTLVLGSGEPLPTVAIDGRALTELHAERIAFGEFYKRLAVHLVQERFALVAPDQASTLNVRLVSEGDSIRITVAAPTDSSSMTVGVDDPHLGSRVRHLLISMLREVRHPMLTEAVADPPAVRVPSVAARASHAWQGQVFGGLGWVDGAGTPLLGFTARWSPSSPGLAASALLTASRDLSSGFTAREYGALLEVDYPIVGEFIAVSAFLGGGTWGQRFAREDRIQWHWQAVASTGLQCAVDLGFGDLGLAARLLVASKPAIHRDGTRELQRDPRVRPFLSLFMRLPSG